MNDVQNPTSAAPRGGARHRVLWFLVPVVALVALLAVAIARSDGVPRPGDPAPPFSGPLLQGDGTLALADLRGRPVVLNFWASWCAPCRDEAPMLEEAHRAYGDEVAFVGINIRDGHSDALRFLAEYDLDYPDVRDEGGRIARLYGLTGQPETFFIDDDGILVEHVNGPLASGAMVTDLVEALLARRD